MAQVYYRALRLATDSHTLDVLCQQILKEEAQHVNFQVSQLARIDRHRRPWIRRSLRKIDGLLFWTASCIVYNDHLAVFVKAGVSKETFKRWCAKRWSAIQVLYDEHGTSGYNQNQSSDA